jgi:cation:H+ antiporter
MSIALFVLGAFVSLAASLVLVTRLERIGELLKAPEAMLGFGLALAADSPEIFTAMTALARDQDDIGVGVILGSNVFNLAALLGLSALVAGRLAVQRKVVLTEGLVAITVAVVAVGVVEGAAGLGIGLALALVFVGPYVVVSALPAGQRRRLPLPQRLREWLASAVEEEESEISAAIRPPKANWKDFLLAGLALGVVVAASATLERSGSAVGARWGLSSIVLGGVLLAAVTSLPNVVAAVYLAMRSRGSATVSEAFNSNTLNVIAGLLLPAVLLGFADPTFGGHLTAAWYLGFTLLAVGLAYVGRGLGRAAGLVIVACYLVFVTVLIRL